MNRRFRWSESRLLAICAAACVLVAAPLLTGALDAQPGQAPAQPLKVVEQNLDANGFIKVHEQGTANVTGRVTVNGAVAVTNIPSSQTVHQAPVIGAYSFFFLIDEGVSRLESFPTINATAIHITSFDEVQVLFQSPMSSLTHAGTPNALLWFHGTDGEFKNFVRTFPEPVPLSGAHIFCQNESTDCGVFMSLIGTSQ